MTNDSAQPKIAFSEESQLIDSLLLQQTEVMDELDRLFDQIEDVITGIQQQRKAEEVVESTADDQDNGSADEHELRRAA